MRNISSLLHLRSSYLIYLIFCGAFFCLFTDSSKAQCFNSPARSGSTAVNDAGVGSVGFNDESNALASDGNRAYATAVLALFNGSSNYLKVTGFGFSIPSYASICGISIEIDKRASGLAIGAWIRDNEVRLVKNNVITGNDLGDHSTDWSGTQATASYGGVNELWGTTLTPADVNSGNFGIAISARIRGLAVVFPSAQIDNIRIIVHYNPILPVKLLSFQSAIKDSQVKLDWETSGEEDGETIILQRSISGQSNWTDLAKFELHQSDIIKKYTYSDQLTKPGNYTYRLKISNKVGISTFSEIRHVSYSALTTPLTYPNPAKDVIILENIQDINSIRVSNISQQMTVTVQATGETSARINIAHLPKGLYFISAGTYKTKFIKE